MKGKVPDKIFLQIDDVGYDEFTSTWSEDRIDESDVEYVIQKQLPPDIERIIEDIDAINDHVCMTSFDANSLRALAQYIKTGE